MLLAEHRKHCLELLSSNSVLLSMIWHDFTLLLSLEWCWRGTSWFDLTVRVGTSGSKLNFFGSIITNQFTCVPY